MNGAPWGEALVRDVLIIIGAAFTVGFVLASLLWWFLT